jgi:hypothetical protein
MEPFTCPKCGSHDHADFAGTKGRTLMFCRPCAQAPKEHKKRAGGRCSVCREKGHYKSFHDKSPCKRCGLNEFRVYEDAFGRHKKCLSCMRTKELEKRKLYRLEHPPRIPMSFEERLKRSRERARVRQRNQREYRLNLLSNGKHLECAICRKPLKWENSHVDHDHKTGNLRGVLCMTCNYGLGCFKDSEKLFREAIKYLKRTEVGTEFK